MSAVVAVTFGFVKCRVSFSAELFAFLLLHQNCKVVLAGQHRDLVYVLFSESGELIYPLQLSEIYPFLPLGCYFRFEMASKHRVAP